MAPARQGGDALGKRLQEAVEAERHPALLVGHRR